MDEQQKATYKMGLTVFTFVTLAALFNIRKYPNMAETHWQMIAFCVLAILLYLIPASLISAELATDGNRGWQNHSRLYYSTSCNDSVLTVPRPSLYWETVCTSLPLES